MNERITNGRLGATANGDQVFDWVAASDVANAVPLPADMGDMTVTVYAPTGFAGTYTLDTSTLDARPAALTRPQISYDPDTGTVFMTAPGLWAHDDRIAPPELLYRWRRDGAGIPDAFDTTYTLQPEDYGRSLQLRERGTDANGRRSNVSAEIVIPALDLFEIVLNADGTLRIDGNDGRDFNVAASDADYAGTYRVAPGALAAGPVALVAPVLTVATGTAPGDALDITPALFAYDPDLGDPVVTYSAGVDASDPANPVYVVQPGDQGSTVTVMATATQGALSGEAASNGVDVAAPPPPPPPPPPAPFAVVLEADGTLRIDNNDGRDFNVAASDAVYAGTFRVAPTALAAGPMALVPPVLSVPVSATPGERLAITPALFAYDPDLGDPVVTYSAGVDASDPAAPVYLVQAGDQGSTVTVMATATQGALSGSAVSNGVDVAAAPPPPPPPPPAPFAVVLEADGTLRIDNNDGRDFVVTADAASYGGTYRVAPGALDTGPQTLLPPALAVPSIATAGATMAITPALFAYDPDLGVPVVTYSAGVDASDPDAPVYVIRPQDPGSTVSITATASQGAFQTASTSNGVALP